MENVETETPPRNGSTITTGVNVADLVVADAAAAAAAETGAPSSGAGGGGDALHPSPLLSPSFHVYWDSDARSYKINNPKVIAPDGTSVSVGGPTSFSEGEILCEIMFTRDSGTFSARLVTAPSGAANVVSTVPIADIRPTGVVQRHVGVIVVAGTYITGESGSQEGTTADVVHGNVNAKGDAGSGLIMKTWKQGGQQHLSVGLKGKNNSEIFGIHDVKNSEGTATGTKIFSTGDVQIEAGGGEDEVDVLTGFSLSLNGNELQVTWHKKKIKGVVTEDVTDGDPERLMLLENIDVVNSVSYNNPNCTQSRMTIVAFTGQAIQNDQDANVFTTTPHSAEHSGS